MNKPIVNGKRHKLCKKNIKNTSEFLKLVNKCHNFLIVFRLKEVLTHVHKLIWFILQINLIYYSNKNLVFDKQY